MSDDRLLTLLRDHSFERRRVTLASGRESDWFIDCKQTALLAEGHALVGERMLEALGRLPETPAAVAGVELGGCPLASAVALTSFLRDRPMNAIYVRKAAKEHGTRRPMEGDSAVIEGAAVAVLEDVVTTGGSTLAAVSRLRERGFRVAGVVALVDRGEGGAEALRDAGLALVSLYGRADFLGPT